MLNFEQIENLKNQFLSGDDSLIEISVSMLGGFKTTNDRFVKGFICYSALQTVLFFDSEMKSLHKEANKLIAQKNAIESALWRDSWTESLYTASFKRPKSPELEKVNNDLSKITQRLEALQNIAYLISKNLFFNESLSGIVPMFVRHISEMDSPRKATCFEVFQNSKLVTIFETLNIIQILEFGCHVNIWDSLANWHYFNLDSGRFNYFRNIFNDISIIVYDYGFKYRTFKEYIYYAFNKKEI